MRRNGGPRRVQPMAGVRRGSVLHYLDKALNGSGEEGTDAFLLQRFTTHGDEAAFERLVHRHAALIWDVSRTVLRDVHDREDVFQATLLVLARRAASIRKQESVASWLHGVAYRLAVRARCDAARRRVRE